MALALQTEHRADRPRQQDAVGVQVDVRDGVAGGSGSEAVAFLTLSNGFLGALILGEVPRYRDHVAVSTAAQGQKGAEPAPFAWNAGQVGV